MISQDLINRINELSKKKKTEGLTPEEQAEQKALYKEYLQAFRANFKAQLDNIDVLDPKKVLLGLSGGVDSAASAIKLKEAGFDVTGYYFDITGTDEEGLRKAQAVANELGIELIHESVSSDFNDIVVDNFVKEYMNGRTPNPCVICNPNIKFKRLLETANRIGAYYIATGHYARIARIDDKYYVAQAINKEKDQSYMLYRLSQEVLKRTLFPLGEVESKEETREVARKSKLSNSEDPDSLDICFVDPTDNYVDYIKRLGFDSKPGKFVDKDGNILGDHLGIINYTIGQRKGLGIALGKPAFVTKIDVDKNEITLGDNEDLMSKTVVSIDNYCSANDLSELDGLKVLAKVRYAAKPQPATLSVKGDEVVANFEDFERAATPGQSIVFYLADRVIGGGFIK